MRCRNMVDGGRVRVAVVVGFKWRRPCLLAGLLGCWAALSLFSYSAVPQFLNKNCRAFACARAADADGDAVDEVVLLMIILTRIAESQSCACNIIYRLPFYRLLYTYIIQYW